MEVHGTIFANSLEARNYIKLQKGIAKWEKPGRGWGTHSGSRGCQERLSTHGAGSPALFMPLPGTQGTDSGDPCSCPRAAEATQSP